MTPNVFLPPFKYIRRLFQPKPSSFRSASEFVRALFFRSWVLLSQVVVSVLDPSSKVQTPVAPCLSLSWIPHQQCGLSLFPPRCTPRVVNGLPPPRCLGTQPSSRLPLLLPGDHLLPRLPSEGLWDLSGSLPLPLRGQAFVHAASLPSCSCCSLCPGPQPRPTPPSRPSTLLLRSPPNCPPALYHALRGFAHAFLLPGTPAPASQVSHWNSVPPTGSLPLTPKTRGASLGPTPCLPFSRDWVPVVLAWDWTGCRVKKVKE